MIAFERRTPIHRQLAAILREQIERGDYPPDGPIPTKKALQETYGVSQGTAERAVDLLRQEGLAETSFGPGVFVVPRD